MDRAKIDALLQRINGATTLNAGLLAESAIAVREVLGARVDLPEATTPPIDAVLHLIDNCLPHWTIQLTGKANEPNGHWRCSLRETRGSDEDQDLGLGEGPIVSLALLEALLRVAQVKARA